MSFPKHLLFGLLLFLTACNDGNTLVVFVDPHLKGIATEALQEFQKEQDINVEFKFISSERIGQHLKFGDPVDVVFACDPNLEAMQVNGFTPDSAKSFASDRLVLVECKTKDFAKKIKTDTCTLVVASETPVRLATDAWLLQWKEQPSCKMYSDFHGLSREYLRRGWVGQGIVPVSMVNEMQNVTIRKQGPKLENWHYFYLPTTGRNRSMAAKFSVFWEGWISEKHLGGYGLIP